MTEPSVRQSILARLVGIIPGVKSLAKHRGIAGKLVIIGALLTAAIIVMTLLSPWITPHDPSKINVGKPFTAPDLRPAHRSFWLTRRGQ